MPTEKPTPQLPERIKAHIDRRRALGLPIGVFVMTFGCQQNEADSEKLMGQAAELGFIPVDDPKSAGLILINTCAIREHAEQKALSIIGGFKKQKESDGGLLIGVCGCMTAQDHRIEQLKKSYPYVDFTLDPASLPSLGRVIEERLFGEKRVFAKGEEKPPITEGAVPCRREKHKGWLSIMYGCNNFCSYCIVPYVRGRERSRHSADILAEARSMIEGGCREITLLGQNVNSYRGDCDFAELLRRICRLPGDFTVRFMTSHPKDVPNELIRVVGEESKIAPAFHLPLQSGSDGILVKMNRRYDTARYLDIVRKLRAAREGIVLSTDIIVGFPGETEEDFEKTLEILKAVRFDMVYSFIYSPRKGTPAALMPDQVPDDIKGERMRRLLDTQTKIAASIAKTYLGKTVWVLADGVSKTDESMISGRTDGGKLVHFKGDGDCIGRRLPIQIDRADAYAMYGIIKESEKENDG